MRCRRPPDDGLHPTASQAGWHRELGRDRGRRRGGSCRPFGLFLSGDVEMVKRVAWLKSQVRGRPGWWPRALLIFLTFEAYYQLCALLGYRPRHVLLDSSPESL